MTEYSKMYAILCCAASDAIDALPDIPETFHAKMILQKALYEAEDVYIDTSDDEDEED
jgi:hypothetical protein